MFIDTPGLSWFNVFVCHLKIRTLLTFSWVGVIAYAQRGDSEGWRVACGPERSFKGSRRRSESIRGGG